MMERENDIIVNKAVLKALGADTRISILTSLETRQKTPSELSSELRLSVPTILEHLNQLEEAGLVIRKDDGHKWKYYMLTKTGKQIKSGTPLRVLILLAIGILFIFSGMMYIHPPGNDLFATNSQSTAFKSEDTENRATAGVAADEMIVQNESTPVAEQTQGTVPFTSSLMMALGTLSIGIGVGYWLRG